MTSVIDDPAATGPGTTGVREYSVRPGHPSLLVLYLSLGGLAFAVLQSLVAPALSTIAASAGC